MIEWETWEDIRFGSECAGHSVSRDQLERWRRMGLLPKIKQVGLGRAAGSEVRYPVGTKHQAIAIAEAFSIKRKKTFVGWWLWLQGYEVEELYWRPHIDAGIRALQESHQWIAEIANRDDFGAETDFDHLAPEVFRRSGLHKALKYLSADMATYVFAALGDIIAGEFHGFSNGQAVEEFLMHQASFLTAFGIPQKGPMTKIVDELGFRTELEAILRLISDAFSQMQRHLAEIDEFLISGVRKELWQSMQILHDFHIILKSHRGSPLRMVDVIVSRPEIQAPMLIIWSVFRNFGSVKSSDEIAKIAFLAESVRRLVQPELTLK